MRCRSAPPVGNYNEIRTHLALDKDAPLSRTVKRAGVFFADQSSADCITNMSGFDFRQAHGLALRPAFSPFRDRAPFPAPLGFASRFGVQVRRLVLSPAAHSVHLLAS